MQEFTVQASIVDEIVRVNIIVLTEGCKTGCLCRTMPGGAPKMNTVKDLSILKYFTILNLRVKLSCYPIWLYEVVLIHMQQHTVLRIA